MEPPESLLRQPMASDLRGNFLPEILQSNAPCIHGPEEAQRKFAIGASSKRALEWDATWSAYPPSHLCRSDDIPWPPLGTNVKSRHCTTPLKGQHCLKTWAGREFRVLFLIPQKTKPEEARKDEDEAGKVMILRNDDIPWPLQGTNVKSRHCTTLLAVNIVWKHWKEGSLETFFTHLPVTP